MNINFLNPTTSSLFKQYTILNQTQCPVPQNRKSGMQPVQFDKSQFILIFLIHLYMYININFPNPTVNLVFQFNLSMIRVVCPNFGHPALTPSFTKYKFFWWKIVLQHLWMNFQFWNCFSFRMAICCFRSMTTACTKRVNLEWRS